MSPQEIADRANRDGVAVVVVERRIVERPASRGRPSSFRWTETEVCFEFPPSLCRCVVEDGMARTKPKNGDWLPWENHGKTWCFLTDAPYDIRNWKLKECVVK